MSLEIKKNLLKFCFDFVEIKQRRLQLAIEDAQKSLESESQSTAGDKHDTSRAMMHLEIEKKSTQLAEIDKLKRVLSQIDISQLSKSVGLGTVLETNKGLFFIAINGGKHKVLDKEFTIISLASPLAQKFKVSDIGAEIKLMEASFIVNKIY